MVRKCLIHKVKKEWIIKIFNVVGKTFLLAIYIRLVIEAYLYFLMSGVSEVIAFQIHRPANIISLALTIPMLLCTIFFSGFIGYHFYKHRKSSSNDFSRLLEEIYANVKETTIGKLYTSMFLLRRIFIVLIVMSGTYTPVLFRAISFAVVQVFAAIYVILRPFESIKDNIIEIINDVLIALFTITFTVFYQESWWTDTLSSIIVYTLISNGFLINFIIIIDTVFLIVKIIKNWKCKKTPVKDDPQVNKADQAANVSKRPQTFIENRFTYKATDRSLQFKEEDKEEISIKIKEDDASQVRIFKMPQPDDTHSDVNLKWQ